LTPRPAFRWGIPPLENPVGGKVLVIVKSGSEIRSAGLAAVRITWITAIAVCGFAIVTGLISGTDSHNSAGKLPGFAFSDGGDPLQQIRESASLDPAAAPAVVVDGKAQRTVTAARQGAGSQRPGERAPGQDTPSRARLPRGSGSQPENESGRGPSSTSGPKPAQSPSPSKPTPAPQVSPPKLPQVSPPKLPQVSPTKPSAPSSPTSSPSPPPPPVSVSTNPPSVSVNVPAPVKVPGVKVPNVSVGLP
jgi:hypothetical protein